MRLVAHSAPPHLATSYKGRVHSVFRRVVNLRGVEGALWTVYAGAADVAPPGAITVHASDDIDFSRHITHGSSAACRGGVLRIRGSDVSIDLRPARPPVAPDRSRTAATPDFGAWRTAWHYLLVHGRPNGVAAAFTGKRSTDNIDATLAARVRLATPKLLAVLRQADPEMAVAAAVPLLGAGRGLTPSGDDFLAGFVFSAGHAGAIKTQSYSVRAFAARLTARSDKTGDISMAYLTHAADGRISQPLANLANAITVGADAPALEQAVVTTLRVGHSSGADAAFGVLCGFAVWRRELAEIVEALLTLDSCSVESAIQ